MARSYNVLLSSMWLAWLIYWAAVSRNVKTTSRQESPRSRFSHTLPLVLAIVLLFPPQPPIPLLGGRFLPLSEWQAWGAVGVTLTAIGLLFSVWARAHLGSNWSDVVTLKHDHELVTSGPYAYVRHPIYTGLLLALVGVALARGEWRGIAAVALATWSFWRKLSIEEQWMKEQFGDEYTAYSRRVAALIPRVL